MSIFKKLYGGSWSVSKSQPLAEVAPEVKSGRIVEGQYGLQVVCTMQDGRTGYMPLSKNSELQAGDELPMATAKVLTLSKEGEDNTYRIVEK